MSHTPEPWRAEWQPGQTPKHTYTHCVMCGDDSLCDTLTKADACRIVACVNALAGVSDPAAQVARWKVMEEAEAVMRSRIKALETFIDDYGSYNDGCGCCGEGSNVRKEYERDPDIVSTARALAALAAKGGREPNSHLDRVLNTNPKCEQCGDTPSAGDGAWRVNSDKQEQYWEHRCRDTHPQAGYWRVPAKGGE